MCKYFYLARSPALVKTSYSPPMSFLSFSTVENAIPLDCSPGAGGTNAVKMEPALCRSPDSSVAQSTLGSICLACIFHGGVDASPQGWRCFEERSVRWRCWGHDMNWIKRADADQACLHLDIYGRVFSRSYSNLISKTRASRKEVMRSLL